MTGFSYAARIRPKSRDGSLAEEVVAEADVEGEAVSSSI